MRNAMYAGLVSLLPYIVVQYIIVWSTTNEKLINNLLGFSAFIGIGIVIAEFGVIVWATKDDDDNDLGALKDYIMLFQPDQLVIEKGGYLLGLLILHYLIPPCNFLFGIMQAYWLYVKKEDRGNHDNTDFYFRVVYSLGSSLIWSLIFMTMQLVSNRRKDPSAERETNEMPEEVHDEKMQCQRLLEKHEESKKKRGLPIFRHCSRLKRKMKGCFNCPMRDDTNHDPCETEMGYMDSVSVRMDCESLEQIVEPPMILADGIQKVFTKNGGPFIAVNDLSFHVKKGECFGLLGKNGAGKSTTMNMLTTQLKPTKGTSLLGEDERKKSQRNILGYCPQADIIWEKLTVYQHLAYFALMKGVPLRKIDKHIKTLCKALTLDTYYHRTTGKLSGGNKRKLQLATSLIGSVSVLFLDEPSTGVDPFARNSMMQVIQRFRKDRSIVLTTHMMEEVDGLCSRVGIMVNGDFRCINTINQLINNTNSGYQMEISTSQISSEEEIQNLLDFVIEALPGSVLTENDSLVTTIQIPAKTNKLSHIFKIGNQLKNDYDVECVISQMTMDQLFLHITHDQVAEDMAYVKDTANQDTCCWGFCCCRKKKCWF